MTRIQSDGRDPDSGRRRWTLHLLELEAAILRGLPEQLRALLADPDANRSVISRLFPVSYSDPREERECRELLGKGLLEERGELLDAIELELLGAEEEAEGLLLRLQGPQIDLWLRFLNDVRLVIATDLGIDEPEDEEGDEPSSDPKRALLEYLSGLESILVEAAREEF